MPAKEAARRHVSSASNVVLAILLVAGAAVLFYYAFLSPTPPKVISDIPFLRPDEAKARSDAVAALDSKYRLKTIEYYDQNYSFSVRYPIGYYAQLDPALDVRLRFSAHYAPFSSEVFDVRIMDSGELSEKQIRDSSVLANATPARYSQDGKDLFVVATRVPNPVDENDTIYVKQAFYSCPGYWLVLVAGMSEALSADMEVADYMISSLRC